MKAETKRATTSIAKVPRTLPQASSNCSPQASQTSIRGILNPAQTPKLLTEGKRWGKSKVEEMLLEIDLYLRRQDEVRKEYGLTIEGELL